jgi:hypothetical protein
MGEFIKATIEDAEISEHRRATKYDYSELRAKLDALPRGKAVVLDIATMPPSTLRSFLKREGYDSIAVQVSRVEGKIYLRHRK